MVGTRARVTLTGLWLDGTAAQVCHLYALVSTALFSACPWNNRVAVAWEQDDGMQSAASISIATQCSMTCYAFVGALRTGRLRRTRRRASVKSD